MTLQPRHLLQAALLHAVLFTFLFVGVQCSQKLETPPVVQGVLINPNDLKVPRPPTPPSATPPKPEQVDEGPQQIVKNTDVVADQAKQKQEQAAAEQKKIEQQKAEEQRQQEAAAKAEELKRQQEAQKEAAEQAAALKKQQEEARRKADEAAAEAAKKELDEQMRKEAAQRQEAQAAAIARQKKPEEAQREAERRRRAAELQQSLGVESAQLTAQVQNEWIAQLTAAIQQAWAWPPGTNPSTKAYLKIRLAPNGQVMSADIATSSGVPLFDQTLKQAAYKASPLPLPRDPSAFDPNITACFSPNPRSCQ